MARRRMQPQKDLPLPKKLPWRSSRKGLRRFIPTGAPFPAALPQEDFLSHPIALATLFRTFCTLPPTVAENTNRQRAADFYNTVWSSRQSLRPLFRAIEFFWSKSTYHFFEDPYIEEHMDRFSKSLDPQERSTLMREIGDFAYKAYATMPILYAYGEVAIDPNVVAEYKVDMNEFGASVGHEYTKTAQK